MNVSDDLPVTRRAPTFASRSVNARLAAGLRAAERWLGGTGIKSQDVRAFLDHLWARPTITPETFDLWHAYDSDVQRAAAGGELPRSVVDECIAHQIDPSELHGLLMNVAEIVEGNLFARVNDAETLWHLQEIEDVASQHGIQLPSARSFGDQPFADQHGWGNRVDSVELARWRQLT